MSTYFSKYTGAEVEALLEKVDGEGAIPTKTSELENDSGFITVNDVATPADGVNATKNAVLLLTSDDLVAERDKWFNEGSGYPSAFEVMDYSATTNSVRLRCYCTAASDVMLELDCGGKVLGYYPPFNESDGGVASLYYWYAFDILVPYVDGAFLELPYKYTIEDA